MKNRKFPELIKSLLMPVTTVVLGIIMIVSPDTAAALVGKVVAWLLILAGTGMGVAALYGDVSRRLGRLIPAAVALLLGLWLVANPLVIARSLGRFLGILLTLQAGGKIGDAIRGRRGFSVLSILTLAAGIYLVLVPLTTSRIFIIIGGIVVLCIGVAEIADQILGGRRLPKGEKPRIIDEV